MPTIRQTGINPQTEEKLAGTTTKKRPRQSPSHQQHHSNNNNNIPPPPEFIPIRTPSALLARDPHHLSSTLQVSLDSIHKLRSSVAECVVLDPYIGHGGYASEIISTRNFSIKVEKSNNHWKLNSQAMMTFVNFNQTAIKDDHCH